MLRIIAALAALCAAALFAGFVILRDNDHWRAGDRRHASKGAFRGAFITLVLCLIWMGMCIGSAFTQPDDRYALAWRGTSADDVVRAKRCAPPFGCSRQQRKERPASGDKSQFHGMVDEVASAHGVPSRIAHAVIRSESNYNPNARSHSGAIGLGQILCGTARGIGFVGSCSALYEPRTNLTYSMKYLAQALRKGGHGCAGVSLYELGTAATPRCTGYGRMVMARVI